MKDEDEDEEYRMEAEKECGAVEPGRNSSKTAATKYGGKLLNCDFGAWAGQLQDLRP